MTYRISLRSSSLWDPRHPLLKVLDIIIVFLIVFGFVGFLLLEEGEQQ
jgi:hypothetical protein